MKNKRVLSIFLAFILSFVFICCNKANSNRNQDIPKNGVVKAKVFENLMFSQDMATFNGENDDVTYQWMFMGGSINNPVDTNLHINFNKGENEDVKEKIQSDIVCEFTYDEKDKINWTPSLSITLNEPLDYSEIIIYKYDSTSEKYDALTSATLDSKDNGTITFTVTDNVGEFYIACKGNEESSNNQQNKNIAENENSNEEQGSSNSNGNYLTSGSESSSGGEASSKVKISNGSRTEKDGYNTDPVPEGKQEPVEPENITVNKNIVKHCTLSIRCDTLLIPSNYEIAKSNKKAGMIPSDGVIYASKTVEFYDGEFVFDVLLRETQKYGIHMEYSMTPMYNSNYIEGIHNLYEFDGGELSGWMYKVNGWFPNYGCSRYLLQDGDVIEWVYTCDLGRDVGCEWLGDE